MEYQDRQLTCLDCSQPFVFTAGEQEFYARKGFKEEPKRCKPCREARKARRNGPGPAANGAGHGGGYGMGGMGMDAGDLDDNIGNRIAPASAPRGSRDGRDFGGGRRGGGGGGGGREMYDATCAQCGAPARVPFRPTAGRPVYCRSCYSGRAAGQP